MHTTLRLTYFSRSVVLAVAEREGLLERRGLRVEAEAVSSSPAQFELLADGGCDLAVTSPDNVTVYGLGDANPLGRHLPVRMVMGLDGGLGLSVVARPGIGAVGELRGRRVGVDVPESGFALALFAVLADAGVRREEVEIVSLGSTPRRRAALLEGACDATVLNAGHDLVAVAEGCRRLARVTDRHRPYLGAVLAAGEPWLDANLDAGRRFVAAWREATAIVLDPRRDLTVLSAAVPALGLGEDVASAFLTVLRSPADGLIAGGEVDPAGLRTVLGLRGLDPSAADGLVDGRLLEPVGA